MTLDKDLELVIVLTRRGGVAGDWVATLDNSAQDQTARPYGPTDSPGELLEQIALELDSAAALAIRDAERLRAQAKPPSAQEELRKARRTQPIEVGEQAALIENTEEEDRDG